MRIRPALLEHLSYCLERVVRAATKGLISAVKQNSLVAAQVCLPYGADGHIAGTVNEMSQEKEERLAKFK